MKDNYSTTEKSERVSDSQQLAKQWETIDWKTVESEVNRIQIRIAKATKEQKYNTVKRLQYLLTHSYYAKLLAVRKVTTNKGKKTAGVDGVLWSTFNLMSMQKSPKWVLEGDIKGCFDHINHEWLIENIPMDKSILKQFLKAGFVYTNKLFPTDEGTPQGGIISPILANMTLDGMEKVIADRFHTTQKDRFKNKVNLVRYADDFIVTDISEEVAWEVKDILKDFLMERGLELSDEKTLVTHIDNGFDMLGWNFRKYNGKLIIKPSRKSIQSFKRKLSETIIGRGKTWTQESLIIKLNQQIRGWINYNQSVCSAEIFSYIDHIIWEMLWTWAKRRHPKKGRRWIVRNYWHSIGNNNWVFCTEKFRLIQAKLTPIVRHTKIRANANPYLEPEYFTKRKFQNGMKRLAGKFKTIWKNQKGICPICHEPIDIEERDIILKIPKTKGGTESVTNMNYVHKNCKIMYQSCCAKAL